MEGAPMCTSDASWWRLMTQTYAFVGGELLEPMNRSGSRYGLGAAFWQGAPAAETGLSHEGRARLVEYARRATELPEASDGSEPAAVTSASVEYVRLFVGSPQPAACPWESAYAAGNDEHIGFGRATAQMRRLFAEAGLALGGAGNQYEDHIGAELLYLSTLCAQVASALEAGDDEGAAKRSAPAVAFIREHPLAWIGALRAAVDGTRPDGYYSALLAYAHGLLEWQVRTCADAWSGDKSSACGSQTGDPATEALPAVTKKVSRRQKPACGRVT